MVGQVCTYGGDLRQAGVCKQNNRSSDQRWSKSENQKDGFRGSAPRTYVLLHTAHLLLAHVCWWILRRRVLLDRAIIQEAIVQPSRRRDSAQGPRREAVEERNKQERRRRRGVQSVFEALDSVWRILWSLFLYGVAKKKLDPRMNCGKPGNYGKPGMQCNLRVVAYWIATVYERWGSLPKGTDGTMGDVRNAFGSYTKKLVCG